MIKWRPNILWYKYHIAGLSHLFLKFRLIHKAKPYYMPNAKKKKKLKNNSKLLTIKGWANAYHENTNSKKALSRTTPPNFSLLPKGNHPIFLVFRAI